MEIYTQKEIDSIRSKQETNDRLEKYFLQKRDGWNNLLAPLFEVVKMEPSKETSTKITDTQSMSLAYRQKINEEISIYLEKRSRQDVKIKKLKQDKFLFYATGFGLKTNYGEKQLMIDGHIREEERNIELIENYVEFLRAMNKNLESLQYTLKNIIELYNILLR